MDMKITRSACLTLFGAPVALVASELLYVSTPDDPVKGLAAMEAHESHLLAANVLGLLAAALFVSVVTTLMRLPRERGRMLARIGGTLGCLGVAGYAAHSGAFVVIGAMAGQRADRAAMGRLLTALDGTAGMGIVLLLFFVGLYLGLVLLMIGAARAGAVPAWTAACVTVAVVLASVPLGTDLTSYAAESLVVVGLGGAGWHLSREFRTPARADAHAARVPAGTSG